MRQPLLFLGAVACCAATAACSQDFPTLSSPAPKETFTAQLTGAAARPAATTGASATATFVVEDSNSIRYEVLGARITGFRSLQLQAGTAADSGRVMATLFSVTNTTTNVDSNRVLRAGAISRTGTTFAAPFTFDSLLTRIRAGTAFVVVRTVANPTGELRGQITRATR